MLFAAAGLIAVSQGCSPDGVDTAGVTGDSSATESGQGDSANADTAARCPWGEARSESTKSVFGFIYDGAPERPLASVAMTACETTQPVALSDSAGQWELALPDAEWVVVDQRLDPFVPNRCVFDPAVEGSAEHPFRIGMGKFEGDDFPMAHLGILPEPDKSWVDVDALDDLLGNDLAGATIDITAPYDAAITQDLDGNFILSNVTNGEFDILFANVELVPFEIIVSHPDKPTCRVPGPMVGVGNDQLNLSVYCQ